MKDVLFIVGGSTFLMAIASWYSLNTLYSLSIMLRRLHDYLQLRIKARRAGLIAYREAVQNVLEGNEDITMLLSGKRF